MLNYDTLFNNPSERRRITYSHVWWDDAFTEEQLKQIEEICDKEPLTDAVTVGDDEGLKDVRNSKVKFFDRNQENSFIFEKLNFVAQSLNNQFYGFNLNGYRSFQYTVYDGNEKGHYTWHTDIILDNYSEKLVEDDTRKLTLILLLSDPVVDFTGGQLQLNMGTEEKAKNIEVHRGRIVAFPSWMIHRVNPVLSGIRKSIVVWVQGPKFI